MRAPRCCSQPLHGSLAKPLRRLKIDTGSPKNVTRQQTSNAKITQLTGLTYCKKTLI